MNDLTGVSPDSSGPSRIYGHDMLKGNATTPYQESNRLPIGNRIEDVFEPKRTKNRESEKYFSCKSFFDENRRFVVFSVVRRIPKICAIVKEQGFLMIFGDQFDSRRLHQLNFPI
jgi:hypothetical protein